MNTKEVTQAIETLKAEGSKNPALKAVMIMFALRERSRAVITVDGLCQRMVANGFKHDPKAYGDILALMARLGFGTLLKDSKGAPAALKDIRFNLQSIGKAASGESKTVAPQARRNRFEMVPQKQPIVVAEAPKQTPVVTPPPPQLNRRASDRPVVAKPLALTVSINGKEMVLNIPQEFSPEEIAAVISKFNFYGERTQ